MTIKEIDETAALTASNEILILQSAGVIMPDARQDKLLWLRLQACFLAGMSLGIDATKKQLYLNLKGGETDGKSK